MANFRKSFNFRNGVQVDNDNLVVNSNGLVGIGTTVPTEALDVRGTAKVVGLVSATSVSTPNINVSGVGTFGTITDGKLTINAGIITAVTGVVTFYGDGVGLVNIPTSQWIDTDVGLGFTSIYAAGNVGVATTDPRNAFQIGGNPNASGNGVGFNSTGSIRASGIITASSFSGSLAASNLTGTINNDRLPESINLTGVVTATTFVGSLTGTATTASSLSGTPSITVDDVTAADISASNVVVSGVSTVTTELNVGTGGTALTALNTGRLGIGTATPTSELQVRKPSGSLLEVISDTGQSRISIGQSVGVGKSTGVLRFGNLAKSLDVINNDTGSIRNIIHNGSAGVGTGNFKWIYGQTNAERMTLTWDGNLGINQSSPTHKLHVGGGATINGSVYVQNNLTVDGTLSANINYPSVISGTNLNTSSGITTLSNIKVNGEVDFYDSTIVGMTTVGIGTTIPFSYDGSPVGLSVNNTLQADRIVVSDLLTIPAGIVTAATVSARFNSSDSSDTAVSIDVLTSPDRIVFTVAGVGTATLTLS